LVFLSSETTNAIPTQSTVHTIFQTTLNNNNHPKHIYIIFHPSQKSLIFKRWGTQKLKKGRLNIHWLYPKAKSLLLSSLRRKGNDLLAIRGLEQSCVSYSIKVQSYHVNHWQKINQYKWKCWENIFIGKTDGNIPLLFTERISRKKKLKQKKKWLRSISTNTWFLSTRFLPSRQV
jgi:hypothetical protein